MVKRVITFFVALLALAGNVSAQDPEGFYEVLRDGETPLLLKVEKQIRFDGNSGGRNMIGADNENYNAQIHNFFYRNETLYALEKG